MPTEDNDQVNDLRRLEKLESYGVLDTPASASFDRLTRLAAKLLHAPVALVSLVTASRQFFKSCPGLPEPWATERETPLTHSFCQHVVNTAEPLIIEDAREHPFVRENLAVSEIGVVAYLGIPLVTDDGFVLGSFCVIDTKPRKWTPDEIETLRELAASVMTQLRLDFELKAQGRLREEMKTQRDGLNVMLSSIGDAVIAADSHGLVTFLNPVAEQLTGWATAEAVGMSIEDVFRIVNEATRRPVEQPVRMVLESGVIKGLANHTVLIGKDGTERPIDDCAAPIKNSDGRMVGAILVFCDVSAQRDTERLLGDARVQLDSALNAGAIATWTWDIANDRVLGDKNLGRLFSISPGDATGSPLASYVKAIHPDDRERVAAVIERSIQSGERYEAEYRVVQPDGSPRWFVARGKPEYDPSGKPRSLAGVLVDITERKGHEEVTRRLDERRRLALDAAKLGSWNIDPVTNELKADERFWEIFTGTMTPLDYEGAFGYIHPEDLGLVRDGVAAATRPVDPLPYAAEYRVVYDDETTRWVLGIGRANFADDGETSRLTSFDGTVADITDRKYAEEKAVRRATQLQRLAHIANRINSAHDVDSVLGVVTEEAKGLVGANQSVTTMVLNPRYPQPVNVISNSGQGPRTTIPDIDNLAFFEVVSEANGPIRLTEREIGDEPRWRPLLDLAEAGPTPRGWLAVPLIGRNGKSMGIIQLSDKPEGEFTEEDEAILVQLSRLTSIAVQNARLYQELRTNDERKDEFLAMLAHELRNPLAAISNAVRVSSSVEGREHIDWSLEVITRQMGHLSRLIEDLMDVSRITRGKIELRREELDATPILESAAATVKTLVEVRKHTLVLDLEAGPLRVNVDPTRLEQVVVNLLNNAAKYSENGGHIRLYARREGGQVVIGIKDKGVGIPPEKLPEMFELFAQGDRSLARSEGGLGIGLTV